MSRDHAPQTRFIIHTVGPVWKNGYSGEAVCLEACYKNALQLAVQTGCESIAFPLIATGSFQYPKQEAMQIALKVIRGFLLEHEMSVYLVVYEQDSFKICLSLYEDIQSYINDNYVQEHYSGAQSSWALAMFEEVNTYRQKTYPCASDDNRSLDEVNGNLEESFSQMLLRLIREKNMEYTEVYKRANIDRKLFSKIRNNVAYQPKKTTVLAFAIALELNKDETLDLLKKAGYILSNSIRFDVIIEYFIEHQRYDIFEINETLFNFGQPTIGL